MRATALGFQCKTPHKEQHHHGSAACQVSSNPEAPAWVAAHGEQPFAFAFYPTGLEGRKSRGFTAAGQKSAAQDLLLGSHFSTKSSPHSRTTELSPVLFHTTPAHSGTSPSLPVGSDSLTADRRRQIAHGP